MKDGDGGVAGDEATVRYELQCTCRWTSLTSLSLGAFPSHPEALLNDWEGGGWDFEPWAQLSRPGGHIRPKLTQILCLKNWTRDRHHSSVWWVPDTKEPVEDGQC